MFIQISTAGPAVVDFVGLFICLVAAASAARRCDKYSLTKIFLVLPFALRNWPLALITPSRIVTLLNRTITTRRRSPVSLTTFAQPVANNNVLLRHWGWEVKAISVLMISTTLAAVSSPFTVSGMPQNLKLFLWNTVPLCHTHPPVVLPFLPGR